MAEDNAAPVETEMEGAGAVETDPQDVHKKDDPEHTGEGLMGDAHRDDQDPDPEKKDDEVQAGERPKDIPEQFWDKEKGILKAEALGKSYADLRKEFNKLQKSKQNGKALDTAEAYLEDFQTPTEYENEEGEKVNLDRIRDIPTDDPGLVAYSKAAKKWGLSKEQFEGVMLDVLAGSNDGLPEPFNRQAELDALGGEDKALPVIQTNQRWLLHLHKTGILNEDQYKYSLDFGTTAIGVETLNKIRVNSGEKPIPVGASVNLGAKTPDELAAMMDDPRYKAETPAGNAYRAEVEAEYKKSFPDE